MPENSKLDHYYALLIGVEGEGLEATIKYATDLYNILVDPKRLAYSISKYIIINWSKCLKGSEP